MFLTLDTHKFTGNQKQKHLIKGLLQTAVRFEPQATLQEIIKTSVLNIEQKAKGPLHCTARSIINYYSPRTRPKPICAH